LRCLICGSRPPTRTRQRVRDGWQARYRGIECPRRRRDEGRVADCVGGLSRREAVDSSDPTLRGKTPENTPHVTASLFAEYRVPVLRPAGLSISGGMYYIGPRAVNSADQAYIGATRCSRPDALLDPRVRKEGVAQANLENATNKRTGARPVRTSWASPRRTVELSSTFEF